MAVSRTTFNKRQKERARQERAAEKAQRKAQRKQEQQEPQVQRGDGNPQITYDEDGQPQGLNFHDF